MLASFLYRFSLCSVGLFILSSCQTVSQNAEEENNGPSHVPGDAEVQDAPEGGEKAAEELTLPTFEDPGGDLGLRALTQMALANSPVFAQAEGNIRVAEAQRRIIGEWQDPEFRTSFDWDDVRIPEVKIPGGGNDDAVRRNEQFGVRLRFYPPNPFEMRADIDKAMAEITYANYYYRQVGREVVQDVRALYQQLQFLQEDIKLGKGLYRVEVEEYQRMKKILDESPGGILRDPVDQQYLRAERKRGLTSSVEIRFQQVRAELASLVGLGNPSRISVVGVPNRPVVGFRDDTMTSLTELAFMNNLDLADLDRLQKLAEGDLRGFKAKKIPWVSFIEGGRDRTYSAHLAINDTWTVRIGMNVPIFSIFSKEGDIYKAQIRSYQKQAERFRKQIERRLTSAVANIEETRSGLARFDGETRDMVASLESIETDLAQFPIRQAEVVQQRRVMSLERSRNRLEAEEAYHDALLALEAIIRADIETVFRTRVPTAEIK